MSITERLRLLLRREERRSPVGRPHDLPQQVPAHSPAPSPAHELGRPVAGTMTVQPLYCPDSSGGGYR